MYVAMMLDAFTHQFGVPETKSLFNKCDTGNTIGRFINSHIVNNGTYHPYQHLWQYLQSLYSDLNMARLADYEIESMWKSAVKHGITLDGDHVDVKHITAARLRWQSNGWMRYEYKRSKRRSAVAPFLRVAAVV